MIVRSGTPADVPRALEIWRDAVDATHGFLTPEDRVEIDRMVADEFLPNVGLWLVDDPHGCAVGFLVINVIDNITSSGDTNRCQDQKGELPVIQRQANATPF